jgi:hypothetical protein
MRCCESLIAMVKSLHRPEMIPDGREPPKQSDVVHWCELIADHVAKGSGAADVRKYLNGDSVCWA